MLSLFVYIALTLFVAATIYTIIIYNNLVSLKHHVSKAWANIDVLLKQRHDELPKLIETCKQHMQYEQETLEKVMQARSAVSHAQEQMNTGALGAMGALGAAESQLRLGLGNLFAVAEDYPDLMASDSFQHLHTRITGLENTIADRREFYNESVNINNIRIEQFPDLLVARPLNFKAFELLEFSESELKDVNVKLLFN